MDQQTQSIFLDSSAGKRPSSTKSTDISLRSNRSHYCPFGWRTRNTHFHWKTCQHSLIKTGSTTRWSPKSRWELVSGTLFMSQPKINHYCFLLLRQVINMYGELIMESAGHKVIFIVYLYFKPFFGNFSHLESFSFRTFYGLIPNYSSNNVENGINLS